MENITAQTFRYREHLSQVSVKKCYKVFFQAPFLGVVLNPLVAVFSSFSMYFFITRGAIFSKTLWNNAILSMFMYHLQFFCESSLSCHGFSIFCFVFVLLLIFLSRLVHNSCCICFIISFLLSLSLVPLIKCY